MKFSETLRRFSSFIMSKLGSSQFTNKPIFFSKLLHELIKYENQPEAVGASFIVWIDLLNELYTEYCVNKEQKNHVIATPDAVSFFTGIRERHGLEINNEIASLLIKPVQRITRYRLLIEQLMRSCTDKTNDLKEAYEVVCSVPRKVNDLIHYNCLDLKDFKVGLGLSIRYN